jgi:4-hydroxyphenylpyruvate dioxygenase-like putative hemolysin
MGFSEAARHKNKDVTLYRQGGINIVINTEKEGLAHSSAGCRPSSTRRASNWPRSAGRSTASPASSARAPRRSKSSGSRGASR